jgi:hypothetical protein
MQNSFCRSKTGTALALAADAALASALMFPSAVVAQQKFITIGTGGVWLIEIPFALEGPPTMVPRMP